MKTIGADHHSTDILGYVGSTTLWVELPVQRWATNPMRALNSFVLIGSVPHCTMTTRRLLLQKAEQQSEIKFRGAL
jgi:hypothetical protein